ILGRASGRHIHALAHNRDPRPVVVGRRRGSIGSQSAIGWRPKTPEMLDRTLVGIVDRVTRPMRKAERIGRTVMLRLRFDGSSRATRSHALPRATAHTETILAVARSLLDEASLLIDERGCTLIGLSMANLDDDGAVQLALPFDAHCTTALDVAIDDVRARFGN